MREHLHAFHLQQGGFPVDVYRLILLFQAFRPRSLVSCVNLMANIGKHAHRVLIIMSAIVCLR